MDKREQAGPADAPCTHEDMMNYSAQKPTPGLTTRRETLGLVAGVGVSCLLPTSACGVGPAFDDVDPSARDSDAGAKDVASHGDAGVPEGAWAAGGTAAMLQKGSYPNPFVDDAASCALASGVTAGPCTTNDPMEREDISEGWRGLPVRLALQIVDAACEPLRGMAVEVWHTNLEGSYSGQTPNNNMCLADQDYASANFFRGTQTTDANGTVFFDTCFPGWYRGRAIHIHLRVSGAGIVVPVSQLFFPEETTAQIFAEHVEYKSFGQPDTTFSNDNVISGIPAGERGNHVLVIEKMSDGAMLASKVVQVS